MNWILQDDGETLLASPGPGFGIVFRTRSYKDGSVAEVLVGSAGTWPPENCLHVVAACHTSDPFDSDAAKANAIRALELWAGSVVTIATTDGRGTVLPFWSKENG